MTLISDPFSDVVKGFGMPVSQPNFDGHFSETYAPRATDYEDATTTLRAGRTEIQTLKRL